MSTTLPALSPEGSHIGVATLSRQWSDGSLAYGQWLMTLLDAQTVLCKNMERHVANLMQPWLVPSAPSPSAQPLFDAAQGLGLFGPEALQRAWSDWAQVWVGALRHDAAES